MKAIFIILALCLLNLTEINSQEFNDLVFSGFVEFAGE